MFVALSVQHGKRMSHVAICGLPGLTVVMHVTFNFVFAFDRNFKNLIFGIQEQIVWPQLLK